MVKNTPLHIVFSTLFSVFGNDFCDETMSLVFDILHIDHINAKSVKYMAKKLSL